MVNVGIVGLGFMGVTHIGAYRRIPGARVVAICDTGQVPPDGDLSGIRGNVGGNNPVRLDMSSVAVYRDAAALIENREIDLVDLCVPTGVHAPLAVLALRAGKHVVCEKPLARDSAQARKIVEAAGVARGYLMPAMCIRFWPEWLWAKRAIERSPYGKVLSARFRRVCEPPAWNRDIYLKGEQTGGALLDLHIHDSDFVQYCFGRPRAVYSRGVSRFSSAIDYIVTQYHVAGDAVVSAEGGWIMGGGFGFNMSFTVTLENATIDYDLARGSEALRLFETGREPRTIRVEGGDGYEGELEHMIRSIERGHPPTVVTPRDGLGAIEICEAEERSVQSGKVVELD